MYLFYVFHWIFAMTAGSTHKSHRPTEAIRMEIFTRICIQREYSIKNIQIRFFPITYSSYDISIVNANRIEWHLIEQWETRRHLFSSVRWSQNRLIFCTNKHLLWLTFVAGCWWWQCSILVKTVHTLLVLNDMHPWFDFHGSNRHWFQWLVMTMAFLMEFSLHRSPFFVQTNKNVYSFLFLFLFFR